MSFDGIFLNKILDEISFLKTGRISKITESGDTDFIFTIRRERTNYNMMISSSSTYSRIHLTKKLYDSVLSPKSFTLFLRKHIEGYFIEDIKQYGSDRVLYFVLKGYNEMQDLNTKYFICEIMGRYSNLILTDENFTIIDAIKHDGIGEYNRTILPNAKYEFPETEKLNPFDYTKDELRDLIDNKNITNPKELLSTFNGISMRLGEIVFTNDNIAGNLYDFIHLDSKPTVFKDNTGKEDFYFYPFEYEPIKSFESISELLDDYYYNIDLKAKIKLKTDDLLSFVDREIKKYNKKLLKLQVELSDTDEADKNKLYGELLLSYHNLKDKCDKVVVFNYYEGKEIEIKLDNKYSVIENSNKFYKKYQKAKSSVKYITEQIEITKSEIEYFTLLKYQLVDATINEALDIQDELIENKYLFKNVNKKGKKLKPKLLTYKVGETLISVGKNNLQNDYLTNHFAKSNEMWFHVKDAPGSHVVLHKAFDLTDEEIRTAAMLAAFYSTYKDSSSVSVDYTLVRNIKKIPGHKGCFVTYTHQNTIYIDPDKEIIDKLEVKK